ncbi:transmembrane protein 201 isoform X3 [Pyxicephalus adspersus]|uniref:transmembrane protein 201 isoform X3 n=1 Tax=Pyxicephalus adspersus TaxID=30357 RepID=UPI003B5C9B0A
MEEVSRVPLAGWAAAATGATGLTGLLLYRLFRGKRPTHVSVNCWFCNQNTVVPYGNRNCWDCPNCEQYNGFQENGDYNKPIPAQHSEHLNHPVSNGRTIAEVTKPQQWVNCQLLLCKKCFNNQNTKIKQLASFAPREEDRYDEEIEVYKHHLEQMYKLCRPCQTAVEFYIKHQNRQLRAIMLNQQLKRREMDKSYVQSFTSGSWMRVPLPVIILRFLAFLSCMFLVSVAWLGSRDLFPPSLTKTSSFESQNRNTSEPDTRQPTFWEGVLDLLPENTLESINDAWHFGQNHQIELVVLGLFTCVFAMVLAGRIRMRRVDAFASFLWTLVTGIYVAETYLLSESPSWLDTAKLSATTLCCLVGFASAVATRKATSQRRQRPRRYASGDTTSAFGGLDNGVVLPDLSSAWVSTPPGLLQLLNQQSSRSQRKASSSSLPGRLNRALSLGTIPTLTRTDSGYLFSGSRPASRASTYKESPGSDYYSLLSGSYASSPLPSPTPSVAGSATSSCGSMLHRRPLISPARLNLTGQKLSFSPTQFDKTRPNFEDVYPDSSLCPLEFTNFMTKSFSELPDPSNAYHKKMMSETRSDCSNTTPRKENDSSNSSGCQVDTTTAFLDSPSSWKSSIVNGLQILVTTFISQQSLAVTVRLGM